MPISSQTKMLMSPLGKFPPTPHGECKIEDTSVQPDKNTELKVKIQGENLPRNLPRHRQAREIKG